MVWFRFRNQGSSSDHHCTQQKATVIRNSIKFRSINSTQLTCRKKWWASWHLTHSMITRALMITPCKATPCLAILLSCTSATLASKQGAETGAWRKCSLLDSLSSPNSTSLTLYTKRLQCRRVEYRGNLCSMCKDTLKVVRHAYRCSSLLALSKLNTPFLITLNSFNSWDRQSAEMAHGRIESALLLKVSMGQAHPSRVEAKISSSRSSSGRTWTTTLRQSSKHKQKARTNTPRNSKAVRLNEPILSANLFWEAWRLTQPSVKVLQ